MRYYKKYQRGVFRKKSLKDVKGDHKLAREKRRHRLAWWKKVPAQSQAHFDYLVAWDKQDMSSLTREEWSVQIMKGWTAAQSVAISLADEQMGFQLEMLWIAQAIERQDLLCKKASIVLKEGDRGLDAHLEKISKETSRLKERMKEIMRMAAQRAIRAP